MQQPPRTIDEVSLPLVPRLLNGWGHALARLGVTPRPLHSQE